MSAGADAFIPDYRLAPESPFPAAVEDIEACYRGLAHMGLTRIVITGDSTIHVKITLAPKRSELEIHEIGSCWEEDQG